MGHHDKDERDAHLKGDEAKEAKPNYEDIHIVAGRINVAGEAVNDFQIARRAIAATKTIEAKLGFVETPYIEKEIKNKSRNEREFEARTSEQSDKSRLVEKVLSVQTKMSGETLEIVGNASDKTIEKVIENIVERTNEYIGKSIDKKIDASAAKSVYESVEVKRGNIAPERCAAMFANAGVKLSFGTDAKNGKICGVTYLNTETGFVMKGSAGGKSLAINGLAESGLEIYGQKAVGEGEKVSEGTSRWLAEFRRQERAELAAVVVTAAAASVTTDDERNVAGNSKGQPKVGTTERPIGGAGESLVGNESRIVGNGRNVVGAIVGTDEEFGSGGVGVSAKTGASERNGADDGISGYRNQRRFDERNERNDGGERKTSGDERYERYERLETGAIAANIVAAATTDETIERADSTATTATPATANAATNASKTIIAAAAIDSSVARDGNSSESDFATIAAAADSAVHLDDSPRRGGREFGNAIEQADSSSDVGVVADDSPHLGHIGFVDGGDDERGIRDGESGVFERVRTHLDVKAVGGFVGGFDAEQHDLLDDASGIVGFDGGKMVLMVGNPPEVGFDAATTHIGVVRDDDDLRYGDPLRFGGVGEIVADGVLHSGVLDNFIEPVGGAELPVERSSTQPASEAERMIYDDFARATLDFIESRKNVAVETLSDEIPVDDTSEKLTTVDIIDEQPDFSDGFDI